MPRRPKGDRPLTDAEHQKNYRLKQRQELEDMRAELERLRAMQQPPALVMSLQTELSGLKEALNAGNQELARLDDENQRLKLEIAKLKQQIEPTEAKPKRTRKAKPA